MNVIRFVSIFLLLTTCLFLKGQENIEKGQRLIEQSEYQEAEIYFESLLDSCNGICADTTIALYKLYLGKIKHHQESYSISYKLIYEAIKGFHAAKNYNGEVNALSNLAELYRKVDQKEDGLATIRMAADLEKKHNISPRNRAYLYNRYASLAHARWKEDSAVYYSHLSLKISKKHGFRDLEASSLNELGYFYYKFDQILKAKKFLKEALIIEKEQENPMAISGVMINLARLYYDNGQYEQGASYSDSAIAILKPTEWTIPKCEAYKINSRCLNHLGRFEESQKSYDLYIEYILKIREDQWDQSLADVEAKYQLEKKENQIRREQQKNQQYTIYLALAAIIACFVILLLLRERRLKKIINTTNIHLKDANERYMMLVTESNHRIKNNLQMIISMLDYTSQDLSSDSTKTLENISGKIQTISALHRHLNFDIHNEKVLISIYFKEIIDHYQSIQSTPLVIKESYDEIAIKSERIIYLGLIINELLSNTIEHANERNIVISVKTEDGQCNFSYEDGSTLPDNLEGGLGIQLVKDLVERLDGIDFNINKLLGQFQFKFKN